MSDTWLISRSATEQRFGRPLTEDEWDYVALEIAGRVDNFIEEILDDVLEQATNNEEETHA